MSSRAFLFLFPQTLTATATCAALDDEIAEAEAELAKLDAEDAHAEDNVVSAGRMEAILEDSLRTNRQAKE